MPWTYCRGRKYWRRAASRPYRFQDEFTVADPNPLVIPRLAEPGPGSWNVVDLDGRLAVNLNQLAITGAGSAAFDRTCLENPQPWERKAGRFVEFKVAPLNAGNMRVGWQSAPGGLIAGNLALVEWDAGGVINVRDDLAAVAVQYPYTAPGSVQHVRIYDTRDGFLYYVADHSTPSTWQPLWHKTASPARLAAVYLAIQNKDQQFTMDYFRVLDGVLPPPAAFLADPAPGELTCGGANALVSVEVTTPAAGNAELWFRVADSQNYWKLVQNTAGGTLDLAKVVAGVTTTVGTTAFTWTAGEPATLTALCFGDKIRTFYGRSSGPTTTDAFNQTAALTGVGPAGTCRRLRCDAAGAHAF
jgi:hypothetical protein